MHALLNPAHGALVLVDYQARLMPVMQHAEAVLREAAFVAQVAQALHVPTVVTEQTPDKLGPTVAPLAAYAAQPLVKHHFNAVRAGLLQRLGRQQPQLREVVVAGCEAHVCLLQTALGLKQAGYAVHVVVGACASRCAHDQQLAQQRLLQAGVNLVSGEMVAFEWLGSAQHPAFSALIPQIKARTPPP